MSKKFEVKPGKPYPLGATVDEAGVNFSVFSQHATSVELLIFDKCDDPEPLQIIKLDASNHHTYHFWHCFLEELKAGYFYAYRVEGPWDPASGQRFNAKKVLIDPYAKGIDYSLWKREDSLNGEDNLKTSLRGAIIDVDTYDWGSDKPLHLPVDETIVYEMHIGNFTSSPTSGVKYPGKFKGLLEKIPYLKSLGITAVELMPVFDFDASDGKNVWGYGTTGFFAPDSGYCITPSKASHVTEFREMVKALHDAGIEVILDVVFGYTPEGDQNGPVLSFKGFDNSIYYHLSPQDKQFYMNYSGCGNTLNSSHPIVAKFIKDCLEYWVEKMHVDGFRFDEASLLSRDENGNILQYPNVLWNIDLSEKLVGTKIFAEPWDAGGAYLVGRFPGYRFIEWNGKFRDEMRQFIRGDLGMVPSIAGRITGSADLFQHNDRLPSNSLNFITAHDGFTLHDLVSYNFKHNEANGENNQDGIDNNLSWNCGAEGPTDDKDILKLRFKQMKNFFTLLLLSKGIPMIVMGDEIARTQGGNNNAYCQNNEISWFDWNMVKTNEALLEFVKRMIRFRTQHRFFSDTESFSRSDKNGWPEIAFHGCKLNAPGWDNYESRVLSFTLKNKIHIMINMDDQGLIFEIPDAPSGQWKIAVNTDEEGVGLYLDGQELTLPDLKNIYVEKKSIIVLLAK